MNVDDFDLDKLDVAMRRLPVDLLQHLWSNDWRTSAQLCAGFDSVQDAQALIRQLGGMHETAITVSAWANLLDTWRISSSDFIRRTRMRVVTATPDVQVASLIAFAASVLTAGSGAIVMSSKVLFLPVRWKTRRGKALAGVVDGDGREKVEVKERQRWVELIVNILKEENAVTWQQAQLAQDSTLAISAVVGKRRARTLRARYRAWAKLRLWLQCVHNTLWPRHIGQLLDYIADVELGSCSKSFVMSIGTAVSFFEDIAGRAEADKLSSLRLWKANLSDLEQRLQSRPGGTQTRKAPQFSISIIISLELFVVSLRPVFQRFWAFCKLLKVWLTLRFDDLQGLSSKRLVWGKYCMAGFLGKTKTTGPGKKVLEIPVFLNRQAILSGYDWILEGKKILESQAFSFERDYFAPMPSDDWTGTKKHPLSYSYGSAISRMVLGTLKTVSVESDGRWTEGTELLIPSPGPLFWTEHSERHVLPSIAAAQEIDKTSRDYLGRWGINSKQSGEYVLTARHVITGVQSKVLEAISGVSPCKYDEDDLFRSYWSWLELRDPGLDPHDYVLRLGIDKVDIEKCCLHQPWPMSADGSSVPVNVEVIEPVPPEENLNREVEKDRLPRPEEIYWVSISRSGFKRLHRVNRCPIDRFGCSDWKYLTRERAEIEKADKPCLLCWPELKGKELSSDSESFSSSESSSESEIDDPLVGLANAPI